MEALYASLSDSAGRTPPSAPIRAFVDAVVARFPELDMDSGPECPWASAPLIDEAVGDIIYFPMTYSGAEFARDPVAEVAASLGLVCYDPQAEQLLPEVAASQSEQPSPEPRETQPTAGWWRRILGRD
ncbi:hypothetical protein [Terracoccus luteus]|nr:hypothetical protein [Terracoccus luteus]